MSRSSSAAATQKPICTICYEDLKPISEDLQFIPVCGHVFHELCLQQWLEYCPEGKKPTCPVCKQTYARQNATRLYFQSTGDATQMPASAKTHASEADAEELVEEVRRLELKLSSITANFENQQMHLKRLNDEVSAWKETAKREEMRREEIKKEKDCVEQFLQMKLEELSRKTLDCTKLQERSLGLAKELAALKLATDVNLGEEEMVKLASLGHGSNHESAVEVLKKSLAIRNKNYKELMVKCNLLGRAETLTSRKLDKAKEKIKALKARLQELAKALEEKENGILRDLKASKKLNTEEANLISIKNCGSGIKNYSLGNQDGKLIGTVPISKMTNSANNGSSPFNICVEGSALHNDFILSGYKGSNCVIDLDTDTRSFNDEDALQLSPSFYEQPNPPENGKCLTEFCKNADIHAPSMFEQRKIGLASGSLNSGIATKNREGTLEGAVDKNVTERPNSSCAKEVLLIDDIIKQTPAMTIKKEAQTHDSVACPGYLSLPGGIHGLEGAQRNGGSWCKQTPTKACSYLGMQASKSNGDLIAVGADGRGGRVKVLRSHDPIMGGKAQAVKKSKVGATAIGQSQIEHFFGKTRG